MELDLPKGIIQHIQSFLDGEEAARTCLLSKSWHSAWSTRSILVFTYKADDCYPSRFKEEDFADFWNYVGKTIKRYQQFNIKLEKLVLDEYSYRYGGRGGDGYSIHELIADASAMGVTDLDLRHRISYDLLLEILAIQSLTKLSIRDLRNTDYRYALDGKVFCPSLVSLRLHGPYWADTVIRHILSGCASIETFDFIFQLGDILNEISHFPSELFAMRSFTNLSISGCTVKFSGQTVICSHLVSLCFSNVYISVGDRLLRIPLLRCPLLENLDIEYCYGMSNINVSKLVNLVAIRIQHCYPPPKVSFGYIDVPEFHKLRSVWLTKVVVKGEFFSNFSSRFPCLKDLTLDHCTGFGSSIHISIHSLEYIQLRPDKELQKVEFDVPNIRKFVLETCDHFPSLSFHTTSMEWETKVRLSCSLPVVKSFWFVKLREFLEELSLSRISLNINVKETQLVWVKDLPCLPTPVVEYLKINNGTPTPVTHDLLCALFRCCRPTFISMKHLHPYGYSCAKLLHELFLINQNNANFAKCLNKMESLLLMYDLEEIDLEMLEGNQWQSTPLSKFVEDVDPVFDCENFFFEFDDYPDPVFEFEEEEIRFRLKWGAFRSCTI